MEHTELKTGKFAVNYGVILGVIMIVISVITYITGWALEGVEWPNYLFYVIFPVIVIYAIRQYKKENANVLSLSQALKVGVAVSIISALVIVGYNLIFNYVIDPDFMNQMMDMARDKMIEDNPKMTEEMLAQGMKVFEMFSNPLISSAFMIAMSAIFGLIYSLIGGLIMKNDK